MKTNWPTLASEPRVVVGPLGPTQGLFPPSLSPLVTLTSLHPHLTALLEAREHFRLVDI